MDNASVYRHQLLSLVPGLVKETHFSSSELRRLVERFLGLARPAPQGPQGPPPPLVLPREDFLQQPELAFCTVASKAFDLELIRQRNQDAGSAIECGDDDSSGLYFATYVKLLSHFSPKAPAEEKKMYLSELLGGARGATPTKDDFVKYLLSVSAAELPPGALTAAAAEVWANIDRAASASSGLLLLPCSAVDLEALMTIPF